MHFLNKLSLFNQDDRLVQMVILESIFPMNNGDIGHGLLWHTGWFDLRCKKFQNPMASVKLVNICKSHMYEQCIWFTQCVPVDAKFTIESSIDTHQMVYEWVRSRCGYTWHCLWMSSGQVWVHMQWSMNEFGSGMDTHEMVYYWVRVRYGYT